MSSPEEPLLPVEPDPSPRFKLPILIGVSAAIVIAAVVVLLGRRQSAPADDAAPAAPDRTSSRPTGPEAARPRNGGTVPGTSEDRQAKQLYDAAEAYERSEPAEYEKRMARWREVVTNHPTSEWARKADEKHRSAAASLQAFLDREFESTRKDAQTLAAAGHFLDAIETIRSYKASQSRDLLRRRADVEIAALENSSRLAFNEGAAKAKDLAAKGDYDGAIALMESLGSSGTPEVAAGSRTAVAQLRAAAGAYAQHLQAKKGDAARRAFREEVAPKVLELVRGRQYEEALKELSAAAGSSANAAIKEEIAAERASIADASSFWEAFLKTLRAKTGQEASLLMADGKRIVGRISRIQADRIVVDAGDGPLEAPFEKLHADQLVGWTLGRSLPAEEPVSYLKAALFFFCEGRDDLARLYLATARELNGSVDAAEKVFREGFLRAAMAVRK